MSKPLVVCLASILAARTADAAPDPNQPAWCKGLHSSGDVLSRALTDEDPDRGIPAIVEFMCFPDGDARPKLAQLEARRQYWMKRMFMTEADWAADVPQWAGTDYSIRNTAHVDPQDGVEWSKAGPVEQFAMLSMHAGRSDAFPLQHGAKPYLADAFALSQAGRIALIADCIHTNWDNEVKPVEWATCQPDIDALDGNKLATELRADAHRTPYDRMVVRAAWVNLQPKLVEHAAKMKALMAKDEVYGKLVEIARATHKEWAANPHADLVGLVTEMDAARVTGSRKAIAGCSAKTWPAFAALLGKVTAKDLAGDADPASAAIRAVMRTPDGYLAANALAACEGDKDGLTAHLVAAVRGSSGYRGPHTATATKLEIADLQPDRRGDKLEYGESGIDVAIERSKGDTYERTSPLGSAQAVVAAVIDQGDLVRVEFVKTHEKQTYCGSYRETNKLTSIDSSGGFHYERICRYDVTVDADTTPKPVKIEKRYAAGITKGVRLYASGGVAISVVPPKAKLPSHVYGIAVK